MKIPRLSIVLSLLFLFVTHALVAGGSTEDSGEAIHVDSDGIAAQGADVVAYHSLAPGDTSIAGDERYAFDWRGATWLFSSAGNRDTFAADPESYAPEFGGYCAWAMARDKLATVDPDRWAIVEGKLYLNYNKRTHGDWDKNREENIQKAMANWPGQATKLRGDE